MPAAKHFSFVAAPLIVPLNIILHRAQWRRFWRWGSVVDKGGRREPMKCNETCGHISLQIKH
jgi:hypothetical protein